MKILNKIYMILSSLLVSSHTVSAKDYYTTEEKNLKGIVRTSLDSPQPTKEQLERKKRFTNIVASFNLPTLKNLPVIEDSKSIKQRTIKDIAKRAIAVALSAYKGEGISHNEILNLVNAWDVMDYFTKDEFNFINNPNPSNNEKIKFAWRYEGLDVLLWALGYKNTLPEPNEICDVKKDLRIISKYKNFRLLAKNSHMRDMNEILDMADYYYRLHWSAIELRLNKKTNKYIDEEIIVERHYALNWLIRYMNQSWDEVTTDT